MANNDPGHTAKFDFKHSMEDLERAISGEMPSPGAPGDSGGSGNGQPPPASQPPPPPKQPSIDAGISGIGGPKPKNTNLQTARFSLNPSAAEIEQAISGEMPALDASGQQMPQAPPPPQPQQQQPASPPRPPAELKNDPTAPIVLNNAPGFAAGGGGSGEFGSHWGKPAPGAPAPAQKQPPASGGADRTFDMAEIDDERAGRTPPAGAAGGGGGAADRTFDMADIGDDDQPISPESADRTSAIQVPANAIAAAKAKFASESGAGPAAPGPRINVPPQAGALQGGGGAGGGAAFPANALSGTPEGVSFPSAVSGTPEGLRMTPSGQIDIPDVGKPQLHGAPTIEGYVLTDELASGEDWAVHKGVQLKPRRDVVVKPLVYEGPPEHKQAFFDRHEQDTLVLEQHPNPNIAKVYDVERDLYGKRHIVMEYIEGVPLSTKLAEPEPFKIDSALRIARDLAHTLGHAHQAGVVHRDLRPGSIMLLPDRSIKVMDFGMAGSHGDAVAASKSAMHAPFYLPPELLYGNGQGGDRRSDVYSISVILYHMLCGEPPFHASNPFELAEQIRDLPPRRPSMLRPEIPPELDAVILKGMAKNPRDRYQMAQDLAQDLERVATGMSAAGGGTIVGLSVSVGESIPPAKLAAIAGIPIAVVLLMLFFFVFGGSAPEPAPTPGFVPGGMPPARGATAEEATSLFISGQPEEALAIVAQLNQNVPDVAELRVAIEATMEADQMLKSGKITAAKRALDKIKGVREGLPPVIKLREKITQTVETQGREAFQNGMKEFENGRYDSARKQFSTALEYDPQNRQAELLREASGLAKLADESLQETTRLLEARAYGQASAVSDDAIKASRRSVVPGAAAKIQDKLDRLNDYHHYATMLKHYHEDGDANSAVKSFDKISPEFAKDKRLAAAIEHMEQVGNLAKVAEASRSLEQAERVLSIEATPGNAYRERMTKLVEELRAEGGGEIQQLLDDASRRERRGELEEALQLLFKARRANSRNEEARRRHRDVADRLLQKAHGLGFTEADNAQRKRLFKLVRDNSDQDDSSYAHADSQLRRLE